MAKNNDPRAPKKVDISDKKTDKIVNAQLGKRSNVSSEPKKSNNGK